MNPTQCHMNKDANNIRIRQATVKDTSIIEAFYTEIFPSFSALKYPSRWNWLYLENPFIEPGRDLPVWIAINKDRVVGMAGTIRCPFQIGETTINASWGCDFMVSRDFRGKGLGTALEKARLEPINFFSLDMSKPSRWVKAKLGSVPGRTTTDFLYVKKFQSFQIFEDFLRYMKIKAPKTSILYQIGLKLCVHKLISALITFLFNFHPKKKEGKIAKSSSADLEFKKVDCFDETATRLWENIRKKYSLAVRRDSTYLNWKFVQQPNINYQRFIVLDNGELCGILIFRLGKDPEIPIGMISEVFTDRGNEVLKTMIAFALSSLSDQGALMIQCASSSAAMSQILAQAGFRAIEYYVPMFRIKEENFSLQQTALRAEWLMSLGDQDLDEYPRAGQLSLKQILQVIFGKIIGNENLPNQPLL